MELKVKLTKEELHNFYQYAWETYWLEKVDASLLPFDEAYGRILKNIIALIPFEREGEFTVLDIGCGVGIYAINLLKRFSKMRLTGIDLSLKQINIAKDLARQHRVADRAEFIYGDAEEWITEDKYDLIICTEVLEHLLEPQKALSNIFRMAKEESVLIFSVPQIYGEFGAEGIFCKQIHDDGRILESQTPINGGDGRSLSYWHKTYKLNEIKNLLIQSGFSVEKILGSTFKIPLKKSDRGSLAVRFFYKGQNVIKRFVNRVALRTMPNWVDATINKLANYNFAETLILRCRKIDND